MSAPRVRVKWISATTRKPENITDIDNISSKRDFEPDSSSLQLRVRDVNYYISSRQRSEPKFKVGDSIFVYVSDDVINESTDIIFDGTIKSINEDLSESGSMFMMDCRDRTYTMLSKLWGRTWNAHTPPEIIKEIIQSTVNRTAENEYDITATLVAVGGTGIEQTAHTGISFDNINYRAIFKPVYEIIKELSQTEMCTYSTGIEEPAPHIFWLTENNIFIWKYPDSTPDDTIVEGDDGIISMKFANATFDMFNMIVFSCGVDKNDNGILWYFMDQTSTLTELKMKYMSFDDISEREKRRLTDLGTYTSISNDDFIANCRSIGKAEAQKITRKTANPRLTCDISLSGTKDYVLGDLIALTSISYGINNKTLRIKNVGHNINKNGWITSLKLVEDEATVT